MDKQNLITINNEKDNTLSFDVVFEGIEGDQKDLRLVVALEKPNTYLMMEFESTTNGAYKVTIPAKVLPVGTHDCRIEVVANEHFFIPIEGNIKVTSTPKVTAKIKEEVEAAPEPKVKIDISPVVVTEEPAAESTTTAESVTESVFMQEPPKDETVKQILGELGIASPKKPGKSLKSYIKS